MGRLEERERRQMMGSAAAWDIPRRRQRPSLPPPGMGCDIQFTPRQAASAEPWQWNVLFLEVFAGEGVLTATLKGAGLPTLPPDEFFWGGRTSRTSKKSLG